MDTVGLPNPRFVALVFGVVSVTAACAAGSSKGSSDPLDNPAVGGNGGEGASSELTGSAGAGVDVAPMPQPGEVFLDPDEVPVPGEPPPLAVRRRGLVDRQVSCAAGASTTVSGTVYIPSGELPLYNVMVYVPDAELSPITPGASCSCEISGVPIASAITDSSGHFVLENAPVGPDIPLVIQVGDWRREFNIGNVVACADTPVADQTLRLPSRQSEGDLPKVAVATGQLDALECLVKKLGVDAGEFTNPADGGRVHLFTGYRGTPRYAPEMNVGADFPAAEQLWYDAESLAKYDIVLLSCDGRRDDVGNKDERALQGMFDYANLGGRIFASHFQGVWFARGPAPFPDLVEFTDGNDDEYDNVTAQVVSTFPKGQAMAEWLVESGVSEGGVVPIEGGAHTILEENTDYAQRWLETASPASVQYISANTPLGVPDNQQCGRVVLSDIHVSPGEFENGVPIDDISDPTISFPNGCVTSTLSPQEAVLAFMLFDLSACIIPDDQAPVAPPIIY